MDKTLFVLPLEERFKCQHHKGVLNEPVKAACEHSFCKGCAQKTPTCPVDGVSLVDAEARQDAQADINELLCYCRYGVTVNDAGQLIADPKGCDHIIKYGNKGQHEATCEFRNDDFVMVDKADASEQSPQTNISAGENTPSVHPHNLTPCTNKDDGCFYLAASQEELRVHLANECPYERLRSMLRQSEARVQMLERELKLRDEEIADLRVELDNRSSDGFAKRTMDKTVDGGRELIEELVRILEEELPNGFNAAKGKVTPTFQQTATAVSTFKTAVFRKTGEVKRGLGQVHPLEKLSEINPLAGVRPLEKLSEIHPLEKLSEINPLAGAHPIDRLIAILSQLKQGIVSAYETTASTTTTLTSNLVNNHSLVNNNSNNNNGGGSVRGGDLSVSGEYDEDTKRQIEASLATYEAEEQARLAMEEKEAAAIAAAAALSLAHDEDIQ